MSDLLARATRELRHAPVSHERALLTLARVAHRPRGRARRWVALLLPIAATLVALGAWAGTARHRSRAGLGAATAANVSAGHARPVRKGVEVLPPPAATSAPVPAPTTVPTTTPARRAAAPVAPPPAHPTTVAPKPDPDALYRAAFEAFRDHDDARALRGWDAYLAAAGASGRFAPEARFNRALTLVHLGRKDEAREALGPFAHGDYGAYRRDEARALLDRL
jgi:hypothetical protein